MKLFKLSLSLLVMTLVFSCVTTEVEEPVVEESVVEEEVVTAPEKKLVEKEVEEIIYYPELEKFYYGNGQVDFFRTYTYDENENLVRKVDSNEQDEVLETTIYTYENGVLSREDNFDFNNKLNRYIVFEYDVDGNLSKETLFDSEDKVQSINEYEYEGEVLITWKTLGAKGGTMAITSYKYSDGLLSAIEIKDGAGAMDGMISKEYEAGNIVKESVKDSSGNIEKSSEFIYSSGLLAEKVIYNEKGKKLRSESYEYEGDNPYPVLTKYHFKSGAVDSYVEASYGEKITIKTVMVEE